MTNSEKENLILSLKSLANLHAVLFGFVAKDLGPQAIVELGVHLKDSAIVIKRLETQLLSDAN